MNKPIIRVFALLLVLFGLLAYFTTRWTVIDRAALQDNPQNKRELLAQQRVARGSIEAATGTVLARSVRRSDGTYARRYPENGLFAQTVGYSFLNPGTAGLERFYNGQLTGRTAGLEGRCASFKVSASKEMIYRPRSTHSLSRSHSTSWPAGRAPLSRSTRATVASK